MDREFLVPHQFNTKINPFLTFQNQIFNFCIEIIGHTDDGEEIQNKMRDQIGR